VITPQKTALNGYRDILSDGMSSQGNHLFMWRIFWKDRFWPSCM